ncbi:MAG: response regulator [Kofleriaceae bacterium]|nr:response regulator [Kofleriaceae bacterium]
MGLILVVEDDDDLSTMLASAIENRGHEVRVATNGREALDRVAERMPDLILLDIMMPVMSGAEFVARFREHYGRAALIVVMTAAESAELRAHEIGADGWLSKPFELGKLANVLATYASPSPHARAGG